MPQETLPALVLETRDYRETSLLVTLLTRTRGRLDAIARGARRPKSALATVQPFSLIQARLSIPAGEGLAALIAADAVHQPAFAQRGGHADAVARLAFAGLFAEILAHGRENDPHSEEIFAIGVSCLTGLDSTPHPGSFAVAGFFELLRAYGYAPRIEAALPGAGKTAWALNMARGEIRPVGLLRPAEDFLLSAEALETLRRILDSGMTGPEPAVVVNKRMGAVLLQLAIRLFESHLERPLRGARFLEEMVLGVSRFPSG